MDAALLLARREGSIGFEGDGDVFLADDGRLTFRGDAPSAPYAYMGVHICRPDYVAAEGQPPVVGEEKVAIALEPDRTLAPRQQQGGVHD